MALLSSLQLNVSYMRKIGNLAFFELESAFGDCIVCFTLARGARICICRMYMSVNMFPTDFNKIVVFELYLSKPFLVLCTSILIGGEQRQ